MLIVNITVNLNLINYRLKLESRTLAMDFGSILENYFPTHGMLETSTIHPTGKAT
jgi:hypothetical protein